MKKLKLWLQLSFTFLFLWSTSSVSAEELNIRITSNEWPPYTTKTIESNGLIAELVRASFEARKHKVDWMILPWARALDMVRQANAEGIAAWYSEERARDFYYSEPFLNNKMALVKRKDMQVSWEKLEDLKDYRFVLLRGAVNSTEFDNATYFKKEEVAEEDTAIKMVARGRADLTVRDEGMVRHVLNTTMKEYADKIDFVEKPLDIISLYLVSSKAHPESQKIISEFNAGMAEIRSNGTYDEIISRYNAQAMAIK